MNRPVSPRIGRGEPPAAALSSARSVVVPMLTTRPPCARVREIASHTAAETSTHSQCSLCDRNRLAPDGRERPGARRARSRTGEPDAALRRASPSSVSSKCSPAVGAATAPGPAGRTPSGTARRPGRPPRGECTGATAPHHSAPDELLDMSSVPAYLQLEQVVAAGPHLEAAVAVAPTASAPRLRLLARTAAMQAPGRASRILSTSISTRPPVSFVAKKRATNDSGVVGDDEIAGVEVFGDIGERPVGHASRRGVEDQQPAVAPPGGRELRDQLLRQLVVEIGDAHGTGS